MTEKEEQMFAIRWCYARANDYVENGSILANPMGHPLDLIVNGVNITRNILDVLDLIDPSRIEE